jgi:hypothetical protein
MRAVVKTDKDFSIEIPTTAAGRSLLAQDHSGEVPTLRRTTP